MTTQLPPSYSTSIKNFVPPPTYQHVITQTVNSTLLPNSYAHKSYYTVDKLELMDTQERVDIYDDDVIAYFEMGLQDREPFHYKTLEELNDLESSVRLILNEKYVQIQRNKSFINKRIISRDLGYYIDQLRTSTVQDFERIEKKVLKEISLLNSLIESYKHFNLEYIETTNHLHVLESKLASLYQDNICEQSEKSVIQSTTLELYQTHNKLNKVYYNLQIIQQQVMKFSNTEDVAYVLKERARVYNNAKDVVSNRQRLQ